MLGRWLQPRASRWSGPGCRAPPARACSPTQDWPSKCSTAAAPPVGGCPRARCTAGPSISARRTSPFATTASARLAAGWDERCWDERFDGCFIRGSGTLGWVADDGRRRGDGAAVLVAHSTSALAAAHLEAPEPAAELLTWALRDLLDLPPPRWTQVQRWMYARPVESRECAYLLGTSGIGLCGDGWGGAPRVETAWLSGTRLGKALVERLS